jgi:hypothetical protein
MNIIQESRQADEMAIQKQLDRGDALNLLKERIHEEPKLPSRNLENLMKLPEDLLNPLPPEAPKKIPRDL